jgi:hypothetical protein
MLCIISPGTGSESNVSSKEYLFVELDLDNWMFPTDSAAVEHVKNPH